MTTHHISHRLSTSLRTLLITATILLVSVSAMAQTEDLTNKINDPGISAISPDPAHWHRGAHVATATTVNFNTSSVPDNNNVNFNSANSGAWMNASTTQANEIWQEFNVNFEAGYLYTISFEQTANTNPVIFSVAYKNSSNGYTNLEHAKVSLNLGPGNRKTYFYYVQQVMNVRASLWL